MNFTFLFRDQMSRISVYSSSRCHMDWEHFLVFEILVC